jgi:multidrug efflux pump subunit AcrA (membrane-fusion protein)
VTVTVAALDIARKKRLAAVQGVAAQDVEQAQATYDRAVAALASARADVDVAEANLQLDEINLAKASIRSPINGVVLTRNVDPGQTVASSFLAPVLFSIAEDLKAMELQVEVLLQFLVEAALFGGLIGILLGLGLALAAVRGLQVPFLFDPMIVLVAFAFSALVGIAFGYFPARRAARLDPIEALRHE